MQRVFCTRFTSDARFVLTGSDETNVRIWKAQASTSLTKAVPREEKKLRYLKKLKDRYKDVPEIRKIAKHRHMPKVLHKMKAEQQVIKESNKRKADNIRKHTKPGTFKKKAVRDDAIIKELE